MVPLLVFLLSIALSYIGISNAQSFTVPSTWRKPTSNTPRDQRIVLAQGVIDTMTPAYNISSGLLSSLTITESGSFLCAVSNHDYITNSTTNMHFVLGAIDEYLSHAPGGGYDGFGTVNGDPPLWGLAAMNAYRAYGDKTALSNAISMWNYVYSFYVFPGDVYSGTHPEKNVTIEKTCNGATTEGGIFTLSDPDDTGVNGRTIGAFFALTARLYESVGDSKYRAVAEASAEFIKNLLYNGFIIRESISLHDCTVQDTAVSYNSGFTIEGLSVLATTNSSWTPFLNQLISTVAPFSTWTNTTSGIITEGSSEPINQSLVWPKGILMRGLWEAWSRAAAGSAVANYIESFLTVQFNAIQDFAGGPEANQYGPSWQGPQETTANDVAQLSVIDVLGAAAGFASSSSPVTPSSPSSQSASSIMGGASPPTGISGPTGSQAGTDGSRGGTDKKKVNAGAIAGGVVGGIVGASIILAVFFSFCRKRIRVANEDFTRDVIKHTPVPYVVEPLTLPPRVPSKKMAHFLATAPPQPPTQVNHPSVPLPSLQQSSFHRSAPSDLETGTAVERVSAVAGSSTDRSMTADIAAVPGLVDTLNRLLSRLPVGGEHGEQPPSYMAE